MARSTNMQRIIAPVLAALLLLAAVAPLCLMFATPVMAAPMGASPGCEDPSGGSLGACPHDQDKAPATATAFNAGPLVFLAIGAANVPHPTGPNLEVADLRADAAPPPAHQVPLRI